MALAVGARGGMSLLNRSLLAPCRATLGMFRSLSTDAEPQQEDRTQHFLSPAQWAKALLAGNVRGQLTSIVPKPEPAPGGYCGGMPDVTSSVVSYLSPRGAMPVILLNHAEHLANLEDEPQASLCTGHLSPLGLVQRIRAAGWLPHRVNVLGRLERVAPAEVRFLWEQMRGQCDGVSLEVELPAEAALEELVGLRMAEVTRCQFVDATGKQHDVPPRKVEAAYLDPLAMCQHDVLTELNEDPNRRQQLRGFCAAYLGVEVDDVLVTQADRLGFVLLGRPTAPAAVTAAAPQGGEGAGGQPQRWRQFRFGFTKEMRNKGDFDAMIDSMAEEMEQAAAAGGEQGREERQ